MKRTPTQIRQIIQDKVIGKVKACHNEDGHWYQVDGSLKLTASVTTKLGVLNKPHLSKWQIRVALEWMQVGDRWERLNQKETSNEMLLGAMASPYDVRDEHGFVGTIAHQAAEDYIKEYLISEVQPESMTKFLPLNCDVRAIASTRGIEMFFKKNNIVPIASEILVADKKYAAGTLDFICLMNGKLTLIDFKTSNAIDEISYSMQVAAYKYFFEKMTGLKIQQCKILHLSKINDRFTVYRINDLKEAYKTFKNVCLIYDWINNPDKKVEKDVVRVVI